MTVELFVCAVVVSLVTAGTAFIANRRWPQRTIRQLMDRIVTWLALAVVALMVTGCALIFRVPCAPDDNVCDGPAMAASGVVLLGAILVAMIVVIGVPVGIGTLKYLRRK